MVYYTDVTIDLAPTHVVADPDVPADIDPWVVKLSRDERPDLYERELPVTASAGSLLIYSMHVMHRGSRMTSQRGFRWTQHLVYRHASSNWQGWSAWQQRNNPDLSALIKRSTPRQRALLGIPLPGHPYWTEETVAGVRHRYPRMDMTPYQPH